MRYAAALSPLLSFPVHNAYALAEIPLPSKRTYSMDSPLRNVLKRF